MSIRRSVAVATAAAALWLTAAVPAWAHPSFRPSTADVGVTVDAELVIPHSCGAEGMPEDDEAQSPTSLVEVQVPDGVMVTPHDKDGWTLANTEDGFSYTAEDPTETTITFPVEYSLSGHEGDTLHVLIYQECVDGGSFSWIGTPDNEAEYPAVALTVGDDTGGNDHVSEPDHESEHSENPTERESGDVGSEEPTEAGDEVAVDDLGSDGNAGTIAVVAGAAALTLGAGAFLLRRRLQGGPGA